MTAAEPVFEYTLVWSPSSFYGEPGKVHVRRWWLRDRRFRDDGLLCGRKGSGYWDAEKAQQVRATGLDYGQPVDVSGIPEFPLRPSATDLPTCDQCLGTWLRVLEHADSLT